MPGYPGAFPPLRADAARPTLLAVGAFSGQAQSRSVKVRRRPPARVIVACPLRSERPKLGDDHEGWPAGAGAGDQLTTGGSERAAHNGAAQNGAAQNGAAQNGAAQNRAAPATGASGYGAQR